MSSVWQGLDRLAFERADTVPPTVGMPEVGKKKVVVRSPPVAGRAGDVKVSNGPGVAGEEWSWRDPTLDEVVESSCSDPEALQDARRSEAKTNPGVEVPPLALQRLSARKQVWEEIGEQRFEGAGLLPLNAGAGRQAAEYIERQASWAAMCASQADYVEERRALLKCATLAVEAVMAIDAERPSAKFRMNGGNAVGDLSRRLRDCEVAIKHWVDKGGQQPHMLIDRVRKIIVGEP